METKTTQIIKPWRTRRVALLAICGAAFIGLWLGGADAGWAQGPPLLTDILGPAGESRGEARVFQNYIEITDNAGVLRGSVGIVQVEGRSRLFVIRADQTRSLIGWAERHRLFDAEGELVGYYYWTPTFSYVYDPEMKKMGEARCLVYQGVCAAAVAGYLLGLL